jgi:hypothetical protein
VFIIFENSPGFASNDSRFSSPAMESCSVALLKRKPKPAASHHSVSAHAYGLTLVLLLSGSEETRTELV